MKKIVLLIVGLCFAIPLYAQFGGHKASNSVAIVKVEKQEIIPVYQTIYETIALNTEQGIDLTQFGIDVSIDTEANEVNITANASTCTLNIINNRTDLNISGQQAVQIKTKIP